MNVITLEGLKPGKVARQYRSGCKTRKAYSPTLKKDVIVCEDSDLSGIEDAPRPRRRRRRDPVECEAFGWVETKTGRRMCRCLTPGNGRIQPKEKCSRKGMGA